MSRVIPLLTTSQYRQSLNSGSTGSETRFIQMSTEATDSIQKICGRRFDEYIATFQFPYNSYVYGDHLFLDKDLKSLTSIINGDEVELATSEVRLMPVNSDVKNEIEIKPSSNESWNWLYSKRDMIAIEGVWGYGGRWSLLGTTNNSMTTSVTTLPVASASGYEEGMFLRIDTEYIYVSGVSGGTVTIERGLNGSTAATHNSGAEIYRFFATPAIVKIIKRMIEWYEEQIKSPMFGSVVIGDFSYPTQINGLPSDIADMIMKAKLLRRKRITAV